MKKPLVTILTPCYNGENYIQRFIDSVISQTYNNIELIIVNDGSTDNTENIIKTNRDKLLSKGYKLKYFYQKNGGQASAINLGLKNVTGDYLTWPDSDDMLHPQSIENKVKFLENNKKLGGVLTPANMVDEINGNIIGKLELKNKKLEYRDFFHDLIVEKDVYFAPGCYMVKMDCLKNVLPTLDIYESRGGQNWQLLLPVTNSYSFGYLDEILYTYFVRMNSHSHIGHDDFDKELNRIKTHHDIILTTIKTINIDYQKYNKLIEEKYLRREMYLGLKFRKKSFSKIRFLNLKKMKKLNMEDKINYFFGMNIFSKILKKILVH